MPTIQICSHQQEINEAEGIAAVHEAFRLGINFFDTSPFYGNTKSETVRAWLWVCWVLQAQGGKRWLSAAAPPRPASCTPHHTRRAAARNPPTPPSQRWPSLEPCCGCRRPD
jgi:hypothetical protein